MVKRIPEPGAPIFFDYYARDCFVAVVRSLGAGQNPWQGAVTVQGDRLYASDAEGEVWLALRLPGIEAIDGILIPGEVVRELGTRKYVGIQMQVHDDEVEVWADQHYRFGVVRQRIGRTPPTPETELIVDDAEMLREAIPRSGATVTLELAKDGLLLNGKECRVERSLAKGARGRIKAKAPAEPLRRILGVLTGVVTLGITGGQVVSVYRDGAEASGWAPAQGDVAVSPGEVAVDAEVMLGAVDRLGWIVGTRTTLPVLSTVRIAAYAHGVEVQATDLESTGMIRLGKRRAPEQADLHTWCVPGKLLREVLAGARGRTHLASGTPATPDSTAPPGSERARPPGTFTVAETRRAGAGATLRTWPVDDFPILTFPHEGDGLTVHGADFAEAVAALATMASRDEARPILASIYLETQGDRLVMVATDSYRLGVATVAARNVTALQRDGEGNLVGVRRCVPAVPLLRISKACAVTSELRLVLGSSNVWAEQQSAWWAVRLTEGEYPNWRQLIPTGPPSVLHVDAAQTTAALRRLAPVVGVSTSTFGATRGATPARIRTSEDGSVRLEAGSQDVGDMTVVLPDARWEGPPVDVAFNVSYFGDALAFCATAQARVGGTDDQKPWVIEGDDSSRQALLMPVRVS